MEWQWCSFRDLWYFYDWEVGERVRKGEMHLQYMEVTTPLVAVEKNQGGICMRWSTADEGQNSVCSKELNPRAVKAGEWHGLEILSSLMGSTHTHLVSSNQLCIPLLQNCNGPTFGSMQIDSTLTALLRPKPNLVIVVNIIEKRRRWMMARTRVDCKIRWLKFWHYPMHTGLMILNWL